MFPHCSFALLLVVSTTAAAQTRLTTRDSVALGSLAAQHVVGRLQSAAGADSLNAVCVSLAQDGVQGPFLRAFDSALRARTGGPLVAPFTTVPLRSIAIPALSGNRDTAWVTLVVAGGGLRTGEMHWGSREEIPYVRAGKVWSGANFGRGTLSDGYVRVDAPTPLTPPMCK